MEQWPKISLIEGFILMSFSLLIDAIGIVLVIFALDDFFLTDLFSWCTSIYFTWFKGIPLKVGKGDLIGNFLETIPYVGALPWKSGFMGWTIFKINKGQAVSIPTAPATRIKRPVMGALQRPTPVGVPTTPGIKTPVGGLARQAAAQPALPSGLPKEKLAAFHEKQASQKAPLAPTPTPTPAPQSCAFPGCKKTGSMRHENEPERAYCREHFVPKTEVEKYYYYQ